jgi:hypothetical protein
VSAEREQVSAWVAPARRPSPLLTAVRTHPELGDLVLYLEAREADVPQRRRKPGTDQLRIDVGARFRRVKKIILQDGTSNRNNKFLSILQSSRCREPGRC